MALAPHCSDFRQGLLFPVLALCGALLARAPGASAQPSLLVLDQDAHAVSADSAGALFGVDPADPPETLPDLQLAADFSAPELEFAIGLTVSPSGTIALSDRGVSFGKIWSTPCGGGTLELLSDDPFLVDPLDLTFLEDGRLVVADWESDPSGLGADDAGGIGHGALFWVDLGTGGLALLADGTNHAGFPRYPPGAPAFEDPLSVTEDPATGTLYVADLSADPLDLGYLGAVYSVDPATGWLELVSSAFDFLALVSVDVMPDGTVLAVDSLLGDSILWSIDPSDADPEANASILSCCAQYALLEDVAVDAGGRVFVADSGEWDAGAGMFVVPPAIYEVDVGNPTPSANAILVNDSAELVTPVSVAIDPTCPALASGLAVNRQASLDGGTAALAAQFDAACARSGWRVCPDRAFAGPLGTFRLRGEAPASGTDSLWFYEHSGPAAGLRVSVDGTDLVITPN